MRVSIYLSLLKYFVVVLCGILVSIMAWKILDLQWRYAIALIAGIGVVCLAVMSTKNIVGFLIYALIFNTSFDGFGKWLLPQREDIVFAHGISLGLAEVLILIAYVVWFYQIFISQKEAFPKIWKIDFVMLLLLFAQFISMFGAPKRILSFLEIIYNIKHCLIYFFLARKIRYHHLRWIVVIILFTITLQSSVAVFERATGLVGIGHSKGNSQVMGDQTSVPGIEHVIRAEGTTADSHSLGLLFVMLLPVPLVLTAMKFLSIPEKFITGAILIFGMLGLLVTFTRSGWIFFAASSAFALMMIFFYWRQRAAVLSIIVVILGMSLFYPQGYQKIYDRFKNAPIETILERYDMLKTATFIWKNHFFFGCGSANYMNCIEEKNIKVYDPGKLPVHIVLLHIAAETGLVGVFSYLAIILSAMFRCMQMLNCNNLLLRGLSLALLTAFIGYLLDGLSSPLGRSLIPYYLLWVYIAISMSFQNILQSINTRQS